MNTLSDFEKRYRDESNFEKAMPPADMWQRIESSLNAKKKNKFAVFYWIGPIAASIALLLYFSFIHFSSSINNEFNTQLSFKEPVNEENIIHNGESFNNTNKIISSNENNIIKTNNESYSDESIIINLSIPTKNKTENNSEREKDILLISHIPTITKSEIIVDKLPLIKPENNNWIEKYSVPTNYFATEPQVKQKSSPEFMVGGSLSPMYSYRQTTNIKQNQRQPNSEQGITNLAMAVDVNMKLNKNWSVESGVRYSKMGQEVQTGIYEDGMRFMASSTGAKMPPQVPKVSLSNSMGNVNERIKSSSINNVYNTLDYDKTTAMVGFEITDSDIKGNIKQHLEYIEIPVTVRYTIPIKSQIEVSVAGGISSNWLIDNNSYLTINDETQSMGQISDLSSNTFSSHAGLAVSVPVIKQLYFKVEPRFNYFLSDINNDYPIGYRPYSFGLFSGLLYNFGN